MPKPPRKAFSEVGKRLSSVNAKLKEKMEAAAFKEFEKRLSQSQGKKGNDSGSVEKRLKEAAEKKREETEKKAEQVLAKRAEEEAGKDPSR